jgi:hypothetical protein
MWTLRTGEMGSPARICRTKTAADHRVRDPITRDTGATSYGYSLIVQGFLQWASTDSVFSLTIAVSIVLFVILYARCGKVWQASSARDIVTNPRSYQLA